MAVPEQTPYIEHTGNGSSKSFSLGFQCESKDHLIVLIDDIEPPIATWSLSGGNVVFTTAPAAGQKITLQRNTPFGRTTDYQSFNNSFRPQTVNSDFDRLWLKLQELGVADWILSNRINDLRAYVDKQDNVLQDNIDSLKNYVDDKDDELRNYLLSAIQEQGVALDQLEEYYSYLMQQLAQVAIDRGWAASFIVSADGSTQQQVNDRIGNTWYAKPLGYELNSRVMLENGDIVKSTEPNNTKNPNVDMTGWVNPEYEQQKINSRVLYFADFINKMDGVTVNDTQFHDAVNQANGREIVLLADDVILLTQPHDFTVPVKITGVGSFKLDHSGFGIRSTKDISVSGEIDFDGLDKAHCILWCSSPESVMTISGSSIHNLYSDNYVQAIRSTAKLNFFDHMSFKNLVVLSNGVVGDTAGSNRAIYLSGGGTTYIKNIKCDGVYNVDSLGNMHNEDSDAIQCQYGIHHIFIEDAEFHRVTKRWIKVQGGSGSTLTIKNVRGSSPYIGTEDSALAENNGMYALISAYSGDVNIDGLRLDGGSVMFGLQFGTLDIKKISIDNVEYHPEYHEFVDKSRTRFFITDSTTLDTDVYFGKVNATNVYLGIDQLAKQRSLFINDFNVSCVAQALAQRSEKLFINNLNVTSLAGATGVAVAVTSDTTDIHINNVFVSGSHLDGVVLTNRTTPLRGSISGVNAQNVTRAAISNHISSVSNYANLLIFGNSGSGAITTNEFADTFNFRDPTGNIFATMGSGGMRFSFYLATTDQLQSASGGYNTTNKTQGLPVFNTLTNKLMIATGTSPTATWVSADGATTITPV